MIALEPLGERAFLARFDDEADAARWAEAVRSRHAPGVVDVTAAYRTVAVFADFAQVDPDALAGWLAAKELVARGQAESTPGQPMTGGIDGPATESATATRGDGT